jgi:hypothetical protein
MLMDRRDIDMGDQIAEWREENKDKKFPKGDDRSPPWGWRGKLHNDGNRVAVPFEWLTASAKEAGKTYTCGNSHWGMKIRRGIAPMDGSAFSAVDVSENKESRFVKMEDIVIFE